MKILLIAPDSAGLNMLPEIRNITRLHNTMVLSGKVTIADIYNVISNDEFEIVHIASHCVSEEKFDTFLLSDEETITSDDLVKIGRLCKAQLFFFNACNTARIANVLGEKLKISIIYTTIALPDKEAWKLPLAFYRFLRQSIDQTPALDYRSVFENVNDGTGVYGMYSSVNSYTVSMQKFSESVNVLAINMRKMEDVLEKLSISVDGNKKMIEEYVIVDSVVYNKYFLSAVGICGLFILTDVILSIISFFR
jgi:hypothetical protein